MSTVNYQDLSSEILNELLDFAPYFRRIGQVQDYELMMNLYARLFPELGPVTKIGIEVVGFDQNIPELDWPKLAYRTFKRLEQLEDYTKKSSETETYFRLLKLFGSPFAPLRGIVSEKVTAYQDDERKRQHGKASNFSRIQTDANVVIQHCADCPGEQQQQTNLKGPRTFTANKSNKVLTRNEQVKEAREKLLSEDL